jgi:hypothetical protein
MKNLMMITLVRGVTTRVPLMVTVKCIHAVGAGVRGDERY